MEIIRVEELTKEFTYYEKKEGLKNSFKNLVARKPLKKKAVDHISFEIHKGDIVGFLGPNGAGKTTTLKMLSGILCPTSGEINIKGFIPFERKNEFKKIFTVVMGQKSQLWWDLPAAESLKLSQYIYEIEDRQYQSTVEELVELLEVKDLLNVQVRRLSLGERMKFELINSLIHHPEIIFLDEPTIGLDIIAQKTVRDFLKKYNSKTQTTIILTSHYMQDIEELCKRVIVINGGKLLYDGELSNIGSLNQNKRIKVKADENINLEKIRKLKELLHGESIQVDGNEITERVFKDYVNEDVRCMMNYLEVLDINIEDIPLEDGLTKLFREEAE